jgi:hypothetical protein
MRKLIVATIAGLGVSACLSTQEMPLAPNEVRLDTHAAGALFTGQATSVTMRRAAELTLQNGYSYFRLEQASVSQGTQLAGVYNYGTGSAYRDRLRQQRGRDRIFQRYLAAFCPVALVSSRNFFDAEQGAVVAVPWTDVDGEAVDVHSVFTTVSHAIRRSGAIRAKSVAPTRDVFYFFFE